MATRTVNRRGRRTARSQDGLTVAVTGARGTIGPALLTRLEALPEVGRIVAMGRHPVPEAEHSAKIEFRAVDVCDFDTVRHAVGGADVVVHMAFSLYGLREDDLELFETNVEGTLNVARAAVSARARRFVCTSSAAVYGGRPGQRELLREDDEFRAAASHFYGRHKVQSELVLRDVLDGAELDAYIFRPCAIVGPHAAGAPARRIPTRVRTAARRLFRLGASVGLRPAVPAPPVALQFVHEDDVAQAVELAILGRGEPGVYNLAGDGVIDGRDAVRLAGLRPLPVPPLVVRSALGAIAATPPVVPALGWANLITAPLLVDTTRARERLGWIPRFSSAEALIDTRRAIGW